jgi:hypothetical protein
LLDESVFQGVIGKHHETTAGSKPPIGVEEKSLEAPKLAVERDPQRLEGARGGMVARRATDDAGDDGGESSRIVELAASLRGNDGVGKTSGLRLLAVLSQHAPQLRFTHGVKPRAQTQRRAAIHAHVERPRAREGKAALGVVELKGRHSEIEKDAVDDTPPEPLETLAKLVEARRHHVDARREPREPCACVASRLLVTIDAEQ